MTARPPRWIAHRGWPARYPENSLEGIAAVLDAGARRLEFDIQFSVDGVPFLLHDADLPFAECHGPVWEQSARELEALPTPPPRLSEAAAFLAGHPKVQVFVEIKVESLTRFSPEKAAEKVLAALEPLGARAVLISEEEACLIHARKRSDLAVGWVFETWDDAHRRRAEALRPDYLLTDAACVPAGADLWPGPWAWAVYVVDDPEAARAWVARGARYVEGNDVGSLPREALRR